MSVESLARRFQAPGDERGGRDAVVSPEPPAGPASSGPASLPVPRLLGLAAGKRSQAAAGRHEGSL